MRMYVGITDSDWYEQLSADRPDEVNFWKPGGKTGFKALEPGGLFLFKLHAPQNYIVGGAHFVRFSFLPVSLAWEAFGAKNGVHDIREFHQRITKYRQKNGTFDGDPDPTIGCVILNEPFWFSRDEWIDVPASWPMNVVQGMSFDSLEREGSALYAAVRERLEMRAFAERLLLTGEERARYGEPYLSKARLGQGAFRVLVTEAYQRRCSITGERTLPVLQASHIKPYSQEGEHRVNNGLLLRADLHILFDQGLVTVTPEHVVEVSDSIKEKFENGRDYYALRGQKLKVLPASQRDLPDPELLRWHNEQLFVA